MSEVDMVKLRGLLIDLCKKHGNIPVPTLEGSNRMTTSNGIWYSPTEKYPYGVIRLSNKAWKHFGFGEMVDTLKHEFAHHYIFWRYKNLGFSDKQAFDRTNHTEEFKQFCDSIGGTMNDQLAGERYKSAATTNFLETPYKWVYECPCGGGYQYTKRKLSAREIGRRICPECGTNRKDFTLKKYTGE